MAGGRPPKEGGPARYPELEELAAWFRQAMADAGYESPNAVVRAEIAHKNVVYGIIGASRFLKLDIVRALAVGLQHDPAEAELLWVKAKEAMDRSTAARNAAATPRLASWSQLPLPDLSLRNLLEAQSKAVERLPYDKLGVEEPPLSAVYVRQRVRSPARTGDSSTRGDTRAEGVDGRRPAGPVHSSDTQILESLLPVPDALARHEHLLITGEPGAGKSTLASHLAWTISRIWLREDSSLDAPISEPVVPVRLAARTLVDQHGSWSSVLCQAARRSLGRSLVADPAPGLFAGRVQGARWLVMVDGLDEIADRDARVEVIRAIAQHARSDGNYRFVVTSRPLPGVELAPLRGPLIGAYDMESFSSAELRDFAGKWFAAQHEENTERARAATDRFLKETADGRLHELVRNPLLATIAAVNATVDPLRPLPSSRLSLYQRFCEHLLTRGASVAAIRSDLHRRYRDDPERRAFHLWLDQHKGKILGELGTCRLEGKGRPWETAVGWVQQHAEEQPLPPDWQAEVREFLQGTGLLVPEDEDYRFLHHSFAEFIAAQSYALGIPPDFPDLETWIQRAFREGDQAFVMFVFCMWSEHTGRADHIVDQLLHGTRGGYARSLLAGQLLAEGVPLGEENVATVLDRLESIARNIGDEDGEKAFEVLGALGGQSGVLQRLERIVASEMLNPMLRLYAVEAFSQAGDPDAAEALLGLVLPWIYGAIHRAARVACSIGEGAREAVRQQAWALADNPGTAFLLSRVATALECLGQGQETAVIARRVLEHPQADADELRQATEAWLKAIPGNAQAVMQLVLKRPAVDQRGRAAVAKVLEELGELEAAARLAGTVLDSGTADDVALEWAALTWVRIRGTEGRSRVLEAFAHSSADVGHDLDTPAALLKSVAVFSEGPEVADWAQDVLGNHRWGVYQGGSAVSAWLAVEGVPAAEAIMKRIDRGRLLEGYARAEVAEAMLDAGARQEAGELADRALRTPNLSRKRYTQAANVLLKVRGEKAVARLEEIWQEAPGLDIDGAWLHGVLETLVEQNAAGESASTASCRMARELIRLGTAGSEDVVLALDTLAEIEGRDSVPYIVEMTKVHPKLSWAHIFDIARGLAASGEQTAALELWKYLISLPYPPQHVELRLLMDLQAAQVTEEAAGWIRALIADPETYPPRRLRLRQMLAWLATAEPWLAETPAEPATASRE